VPIASGTFVVGLSLAGILLGGPPPPAPASAPATAFSAERAMRHVEQIAVRPHPLGSPDHARVRDYLVTVLEKLGFTVERQTTIVRSGSTALRMARVENLMVRLKGTQSTGAVLLAAHYDSVPAAPGAADAAAGVAGLLDAARAIKAGDPLKNDVIVLLTDGEEFGLLGAAAFADEHPWAKDVRMVLNFEARGTSGPSQMLETSAGNGVVVAAWATAAPKPTGSSLTYEVYKYLPNDTDFVVFEKLKTAGLNFAFLGDWANYHTPRDSAANLDRGSLQHHGATALSLARRFGSIDLAGLGARDAVYFPVPIAGVAVHYSSRWAAPLAVAAAALYILAVVRARRRNQTSFSGLFLAILIFSDFGGLAAFWGGRVGRLAGSLHTLWLPEGNVLLSGAYGAALAAAIIAAWCGLYVLMRKRFAAHTIALGAMLPGVLTGLASTWFFVGGSYVLVWPLAGGICAVLALAPGPPEAGTGAGRALAVSLLGAPAILIVWPVAHTLFGVLGMSLEGGAAIGAVTALALGMLAPQLEVITEGRRWWPAWIGLAATLACIALGMTLTRYSDRHPKPVNLLYVMDADAKSAHWTSRVDAPGAWLEQYLGAAPGKGRPAALVPPWSSSAGIPGFLNGAAPVIDLAAPQATLVANVPAEGGRTVTFRVKPAREGDALSVWVNGVPMLDAVIDGRRITAPTAPRAPDDTAWTLDYMNAPAAGAAITLTLKGSRPLTVAVVNRTAGLPDMPGSAFRPRPPSLMPVENGDETVVRRSYVF
jgi:hypothetical protein